MTVCVTERMNDWIDEQLNEPKNESKGKKRERTHWNWLFYRVFAVFQNSFWPNLHIPIIENPLKRALGRDRAAIKLFPICSRLYHRCYRCGLMLCIFVRKKKSMFYLSFICNFRLTIRSPTADTEFDEKVRYLGCASGKACTSGSKRKNVQNIWFARHMNNLCQHSIFVESQRSLTTLVIRANVDILFVEKTDANLDLDP